MNDKIQEYNYIVEHNHIIEKQKDHLEMQKVK